MKIELDVNEITIILNALDTETKSAKRAQTSGKTPQIKEVYAQHERVISALAAKIGNAK